MKKVQTWFVILPIPFLASSPLAAEVQKVKTSPPMALSSRQSNAPLSRKDRDEVQRAFYTYMMAKYKDPKHFHVYFLSYKGKTPAPGILYAFAGHVPPVKARSQGHLVGETLSDVATGKAGILFFITSLTTKNSQTATIRGGWYAGPVEAISGTYTAIKQSGRWKISAEKVTDES